MAAMKRINRCKGRTEQEESEGPVVLSSRGKTEACRARVQR